MKNPVAAVSSLLFLTLIGPVVAQAPRVVDGPELVATGTVISVGNSSMAIRTLDHGHPISFVVTTTTVMPASVVVGSRVRIAYHAVGATGQLADTVTLLEGPPGATSTANEFIGTSDAPPAPQTPDAEQPDTRAAELPATASPLPAIGLLGLMALLASISLRARARARS